jgi:hypothetical protein
MTERKQGEFKAARCRGKRFLFAAIIISILIIIAILAYKYLDYRSIDERLAAIEASMAIPDSENAAILYSQILQNPDASLKDQPTFLDPNRVTLTRSQPWTANDYPKLAVWIKKHQWLINELMKVSQFEKCQFPLIVEANRSIQMKRLQTMRKWRFLLCQAANNDIGEGKIDDAIAKWQCLIQIGKHLRQQSQLIEYIEGMGTEFMGIVRTIDFLAECNVSESHLQKIESFKVQTHDNWPTVLDRIQPVEEIGEQKFKRQLSLFGRFKYEFGLGKFKGLKDIHQIVGEKHLRMLVNQRGMYIMVALRRYKNEHGHWPDSLDAIKSAAPAEAFIDPVTGEPLQYENHGERFSLYGEATNIWPR